MPNSETPTGWQQAEQPDDEMTRYSPQPVTEYEHTETNVSIQLIPSDSQTGSASEGGYRINLRSDSAENIADVEHLTDVSDHTAALGVARKFMDAYNDQCVKGSVPLDIFVQEFSKPD